MALRDDLMVVIPAEVEAEGYFRTEHVLMAGELRFLRDEEPSSGTRRTSDRAALRLVAA